MLDTELYIVYYHQHSTEIDIQIIHVYCIVINLCITSSGESHYLPVQVRHQIFQSMIMCRWQLDQIMLDHVIFLFHRRVFSSWERDFFFKLRKLRRKKVSLHNSNIPT